MNLVCKNIKNNKGFSLIELLGAMVIVSIIGVLTIVGVQRYISQSKEQKTVQNEKNVSLAAELYLQANRDLYPKMIGDKKRIQISDLREANYIKEDVTNERDEDCMKESYVLVTKITENDYSYVTKLYCGDAKAPEEDEENPPYLETIKNEEGKSGKIVFSKSTDVRTASFSFKLRGDKDNESIRLASYAYVILGKTSLETEYTELYNSGIIDAKGKTMIEFNSRPINAYIDLAGVTSITVRVTALNEKGGYLKYDEKANQGTGKADYEDKEKPLCPPVYEYGSRLGEPTSLDDWVSKEHIGTDKYPRVITLKCDDGNGSGCKRDTFSQAWPNVNNEKQQYGVLFGQIRIEDNAVINENGKKKLKPNYEDCDVNIFVDLQAPTVEILPVNPTPQYACGESGNELCPKNVGRNIVFNDKPVPDGTTIEVKDPTKPLEELNIKNNLTIESTNYANYHADGASASEGWLNAEYYPEGIMFKVKISDNLYLDSYTWEVNDRWHGSNSPDVGITYSEPSAEHPEAQSWYRRNDPSDDMYIDETLLYEQKNNYKFNNVKDDILLYFYDEGVRYGVLTVKDRAGNETKVYIHANLDRTEPSLTVDKSGYLSFYKLNINEDEPLEYVDQDIDGELDFQYESWKLAHDLKDKSLRGGFGALLDTVTFKDYSDEEGCWFCNDDSGGGLLESYKPYGTKKEPKYCTPETSNGYGIIEGTNYDEVEISEGVGGGRSGCYKVGVTKGYGDNQFVGKERVNYEDPDVFNELLIKKQEYVPGTWSNEELVCGPYDQDMYDTRITERLPDGKFVVRQNPNGEEISRWGGTRIRYYKQVSVMQDPDDPDKLLPVQSETITESKTINKRDRSQWPRFKDQGTHKLVWSNCDAAGNCTGFKSKEYLKIDTIAPQCNNSVEYNDELNSDGTTGPNHNGWLYDKQEATVYHDCADSSDLNNNDYLKAYKSLRNQTRDVKLGYFDNYLEWGSGCDPMSPTDERMVYSNDVYTCSAGTRGIGNGYYGEVMDYAGNVRKCSVGATIRKDTTPPLCAARAFYEGKNGDGEYNQPNIHGWAIGGMSIYTKKSCEDTYFAKGLDDYPGANMHAISGCTYKDDYELNGTKTRVQSTHKGLSTTETLPLLTENGMQYYLPENNSRFYINDDKDIDGRVGSSEPEINAQGKTVFRNGYVVDRAGNVSDDNCQPVWVRRDSVAPNCKNDLVSPNNMYAEISLINDGRGALSGLPDTYVEGYTERDAAPWTEEDGVTKWFGSSGKDGNKEYAQVQKGCIDKEIDNYPGISYPEKVSSGCKHYIDPQKSVWYYGQKIFAESEENKNNITWVDDNTYRRITNATYLGPRDTDIICDDEVYDDAGNYGGGTANRIVVNIDYVAPVCGPIELLQGEIAEYEAGRTRKFCNGSSCYDSSRQNEMIYTPPTTPEEIGTRYMVTPTATCVSDVGSGCLPYNGLVTINDETYKSWDSFGYLGKNSDQFTTVYAFDYARNITRCSTTFSLRQDKQPPIIQSCKYKANYVRDGDDASYIDITISGIEDPISEPDNYASGLDLENSYLNNGIMLMAYTWYSYGKYRQMLYYDEKDRTNSNDADPGNFFGFSRYYSSYCFYNSWACGYKHFDPTTFVTKSYSRDTWYDWFPSNTKLAPQESHNTSTGTSMYKDADGTVHIHSPLTCAVRKSYPFPLVILQDQSGNRSETPCEPETPEDKVIIPGCCDEVEGRFDCKPWEWTDCTKPCDGGTMYQKRSCTADSKFRDGKRCPVQEKRNEDTPCNTMDCCEKTVVNYRSTCSNGFDEENPCSFGQEEKREMSFYDSKHVCVPYHIETCQVDKDACQEEIARAKTNGETINEEIGQQIELYIQSEKWAYIEDEDRDVRLLPRVQNGKTVPFEYYYYDLTGNQVPICDIEGAKEFMKDEYKEDESIVACSQIEDYMFNVDAENHLYKTISLYNYIASPSSCQLWIDRVVRGDWVSFMSVDTKNCKIDTEKIKANTDNCSEKANSEYEIRANITREGSYDINGQKSAGCSINVEWENSNFTYDTFDSSKYKRQNYIAVKCEDKTGKKEYCLESCTSGICVSSQ